MSRVEIKGDKFDIAFGVDHVTGAFVQLWVSPASEQDCSFIKIDSFGVEIDHNQVRGISAQLRGYVQTQMKRFENWNRTGRPNIDPEMVISLARYAGGFPDITQEVYRVFD